MITQTPALRTRAACYQENFKLKPISEFDVDELGIPDKKCRKCRQEERERAEECAR